MMYYIDTPNFYRAANRKWEELKTYVEKFKHCLVKDDRARDEIIKQIRQKVEELNAAYQRTKPLEVNFYHDIISCAPKDRNNDDCVFTIMLRQVKRTYCFSESGLLEGGAQ